MWGRVFKEITVTKFMGSKFVISGWLQIICRPLRKSLFQYIPKHTRGLREILKLFSGIAVLKFVYKYFHSSAFKVQNISSIKSIPTRIYHIYSMKIHYSISSSHNLYLLSGISFRANYFQLSHIMMISFF